MALDFSSSEIPHYATVSDDTKADDNENWGGEKDILSLRKSIFILSIW